ncbi:L,D-transpeptidase catalytic domain protein [Acinetobacter pittii]|uniref:L,D-transpeptidase family protein n=1 Tax=Acinetobacter calcoaceticus/baumannii complex TaxID=909768 RepID=UPI00029E50AF|nr:MULTISPECIES: L,D-transpeptidase family protein [Acinetobacter calcoaceticus/baumannii complex]OIG44798.1 L,D-transpeptidase catalytic domain protein [Acinetobacter baumannii]AUT33155.1 L,D-transpeptidase family protein [Acinetobacter pittii]AVN20951.1 L,D-transpeptidase family protein [Acinetobacter pittii]AZB94274.1 L,D-transpeptidase catalytic domain protein [Acinetobacter pittii]EKU69140.1 L,D-transpeptidase catalytic domain protein [Acinetobacter pittii]
MKIRPFIICTLLIIPLGIAFYNYEKYLPTFTSSHQALSKEEILELIKTKPVTSIEVFKNQRLLLLKSNQDVIRQYPIRLGFNPKGHKHFENDGRTPEGIYSIDWRNSQSAYYKSLHISYPNAKDIAYAKQHHQPTGGDIMIHGSVPKSLLSMPFSSTYMPHKDWTLGCIAVRNVDIDEIWQLVPNKTKIIIYP